MTPILQAAAVTKTYRAPRRSLFHAPDPIVALDAATLVLQPGETLGLVGESGSGKSTLARLLVLLERPDAGEVLYAGRPMSSAPPPDRAGFRRDVQIVLQNPYSSLDPRLRVGQSIAEPLRALRIDGDHEARVREVLEAVGLGAVAARRYPHQFSGGQRQRIAIARALAPEPRILVADEPVSALDVSVQAQILNLLDDLRARLGLTLLLISHDLAVVSTVCDRVAVMRSGRIVEDAPTRILFDTPEHVYTRQLLTHARALGTVDA